MKIVLLSADSMPDAYLVPDVVAKKLAKYCGKAFYDWMRTGKYAEKYYRTSPAGYSYYCFNEKDFILYLNEELFPDEKSTFVEHVNTKELELKYKRCPSYNF